MDQLSYFPGDFLNSPQKSILSIALAALIIEEVEYIIVHNFSPRVYYISDAIKLAKIL